MTKTKTYQTFNDLIASVFILLFVYTALCKLFDFTHFKYVLIASPSIRFAAGFLAWFLPTIELLTAALLFKTATRIWGLIASMFLMLMFTAYIGYMILFTPDRPCNCGGVLKELNWTQHFFLNVGLTLLAGVGLLLPQTDKRFIAINRKSRTPV